MVNRKTKVIHICDKFGVNGSTTHGVSRMFSWLFPRFDRNKYEVHLVGLRKPDNASEHLRQMGIEVHSLGKEKFDFSTIAVIAQMVKKERADILHLHGYGSTNCGLIAARIVNVKTIVHEHFVDPAMPRYQVPFDYCLTRYADLGIAASNSVKTFMTKKRFLPEEKVRVVYYGTSLDEFKPVSGEAVLNERRRWRVPEDCRIIGVVARLDVQKGLSYFIDAAAKLLDGGYNKITFLIVGDGPQLVQLKEQCQRRSLLQHMIFTGYQANMPLIESMIDIQVFPSLWEGTPLALFEAMSMGRPIVSTNVDGLGEILRQGENGLLVPPRDSDGLALAIGRLLRDPDEAKRMASQAQVDSCSFDVRHTVTEIQRIYDALMDLPNQRQPHTEPAKKTFNQDIAGQ